MAAKYNMPALKQIGMSCKNRLPPANAVQAMFLYEMQREADVQALFEGQMFELARVEDVTKSYEPRIEELETQMIDIQKKANRQDVDERLATTKVRTDALAARLNEHFIRLGEYGRRLTDVETTQRTTKEQNSKEIVKLSHQLDAITEEVKTVQNTTKQDNEQENVKLDTLATDIKTLKSTLEAAKTSVKQDQQKNKELVTSFIDFTRPEIKAIKASLESADKEIGLLFEERDALYDRVIACEGQISELKKSNERINKLEDLVRALTLQKSPTISTNGSLSPSVHFCPVTTKGGGDSYDLVVPKGKGLVLGKEDVKAFVPGKSWGS